jgi:RNA polymerase sigma factor (sigma-70 family)
MSGALTMNVPDGELQLRWLKERDADAFAEIVFRHGSMVFGACRRVLRNASDAEEVAQDCFLQLAEWRKRIHPSLGGWLYTVATRKALNRLRSDTRRARNEAAYGDTVPAAQSWEWNDVREWIDEALLELPPNQRAAIVHRFFEGRSHEECGAIMHVPVSTARYRARKGVDRLRKILHRRGVIVSSVLIGETLAELSAHAMPASLQSGLNVVAMAGGSGVAGSVSLGTLAASNGIRFWALSGGAITAGIAALVALGVGVTSARGGEGPTVLAQASADSSRSTDRGLELSASEVVEAHLENLFKQIPFVFDFTDHGHVSVHATTPENLNPALEGEREYHMAGQLASDGFRVAYRNKTWGQYNGVDRPPVAKADAQYYRDVFDGDDMWWYFRPPRNTTKPERAAGKIGIQDGSADDWYKVIVGQKAPTHWFQGYVSERRDRIDALMSDAYSLTVRAERETVGRSKCDVVEFESPYARGTLWFDPARGYLLAKAELLSEPGHLNTNGHRLGSESSIHFKLSNVSFTEAGGVWFATGGDVWTDLRTGQFQEVRTNHVTISNIRAHADLDKLGVFSTKDITEGARVGYFGQPITHYWRHGQMVTQ